MQYNIQLVKKSEYHTDFLPGFPNLLFVVIYFNFLIPDDAIEQFKVSFEHFDFNLSAEVSYPWVLVV